MIDSCILSINGQPHMILNNQKQEGPVKYCYFWLFKIM